MRPTALAAVLAGALALTAVTVACSSGGDEPDNGRDEPVARDGATTTTKPRLDIDPRRYFDEYQASSGDGAMTAGAPVAPAPQSAADSAVGSAAGSGAARTSAEAASTIAPTVPPEPPEPGIFEDNTFVDPGASPFVATSGEPESTFALDVDTGSYSVGRTFLDQGSLPPPGSVRTEEWVNAFGYDDPAPDDGDDLGITVAGAPAPFADDGTQLLRVGITARAVALEDRPTAHLTFVVDTSGSMDIRERLGLVRSTLALLALHLRDDDTVSVVTYGDDSNVLLPPTPAAEAQTIVDTIDALVPGGSTNMEAGLRAGYGQARARFDPAAVNAVVLASDGVANAGVTGTDELAALIRSEGEDGIRLVTVGYGMGNYNDDLMEQLADRGDGFYSYVDTYDEAERLFTGELTSTLTVVAEEAKAQVTFDPAAVGSYRLVGYENRALSDEQFRDDAVDAGELGAGHGVTALYEVRPVADGPDELGSVSLRHRPVGGGGDGQVVEQTVPLRAADLAPSFEEANPDVRLAGTVVALAELLGRHPTAAERATTFDDLADLAAELVGDGGPTSEETGRPDAAELLELIDLARGGTPPIEGGGERVPLPTPVPTPVPTPR